MKESEMFRMDKILKKAQRKYDKEVDKITNNQVNNIGVREDSYKPDGTKFTDYLEFTKKYPEKGYLEFRKFCRGKNKGKEVKK